METPRPEHIFRRVRQGGLMALAFLLVASLLACRAAQVPWGGARPWPKNAVDREIRRLSEQAQSELAAPPGPAREAREGALLTRLDRLPRSESLGYRLDRALLEAHLRRAAPRSRENPNNTATRPPTQAALSPGAEAEARDLIAGLVAVGLEDARGLVPVASATTAEAAVLLALADRVRPQLPISPARAAFETPDFREAWVKLGPSLLEDLGLRPKARPRPAPGGLVLAYAAIRKVREERFQPWEVARLLLGLGSDDPALVHAALVAMNALPEAPPL